MLRAMLVFLRIAWVNVVAVVGVAMAMVPLMWRRRPVGNRTATSRRQPARVIPIAQRRRVQNR